MADSDNTTTLPFVTRRRKRRIVVFNHAVPGAKAEARDATEVGDPAVATARLWRDAQARSMTLCRRQQRLETALMRSVGSPLAAAANEAEARAARWRKMDRELGYSRTKRAEEQAAQVAEQLLETLARTPARFIEGVIASWMSCCGKPGRMTRPAASPGHSFGLCWRI
jgi:crotonobetainyl-CoA:carnitine CoA-transferase CaiB-like acyl-CoA transferase